MKQTNHDNIRPFHGVSSDVSDFCLVFPWYKNGNIMKYLKENPDINRYQLVSTFHKPHAPDVYPNLTDSYRVRHLDCASCTRTAWFMEPYAQYVGFCSFW